MALDMFINLGDKITGETKDKAQSETKDIDILSWNFGASQSGAAHYGGGVGAGKVSIQDITIAKMLDVSSPKILKHCCEGTEIPEVKILCRKSGGKQEPYLKITLKDCILTSYMTNGAAGGDDRLYDSFSINFAKFTFDYWKQDATGVTSSAGEFTYSIAENSTE